MKTIVMMGLSYLIRTIGSVLMMALVLLCWFLSDNLTQGVIVITIGETVMLIISVVFTFWLSLRLMMYGK
jgi:hypothetical protein